MRGETFTSLSASSSSRALEGRIELGGRDLKSILIFRSAVANSFSSFQNRSNFTIFIINLINLINKFIMLDSEGIQVSKRDLNIVVKGIIIIEGLEFFLSEFSNLSSKVFDFRVLISNSIFEVSGLQFAWQRWRFLLLHLEQQP